MTTGLYFLRGRMVLAPLRRLFWDSGRTPIFLSAKTARGLAWLMWAIIMAISNPPCYAATSLNKRFISWKEIPSQPLHLSVLYFLDPQFFSLSTTLKKITEFSLIFFMFPPKNPLFAKNDKFQPSHTHSNSPKYAIFNAPTQSKLTYNTQIRCQKGLFMWSLTPKARLKPAKPHEICVFWDSRDASEHLYTTSKQLPN
jgi:hypothetical protein